MPTTVVTTDTATNVVDVGVQGPPGPAGGSAAGNIVTVDAVNGNDGTGVRGRPDKPFLTLAAAKAAAQSGDTVVVYPGTYNEKNLAKDGVNWRGLPGANINYTGTANGGVFDDSALGTNGAASYTLEWAGSITHSGGPATLSAGNHALNVSNAGSAVRVRVGACAIAGANHNDSAAVRQTAGTLTGRIDDVNSASTSATFGYAVWWDLGTMDLVIGQILGTNNAGACVYVHTPGSVAAGHMRLRCGKIYYAGSRANTPAISIAHDCDDIRSWIDTIEIRCDCPTAYALISAGGKNYVTCEKISAPYGPVNSTGGWLWLTAQKYSVDAAGHGTVITDGSAWLTLLQVEDLGCTNQLFTLNATAGNVIDVSCRSLVTTSTADGFNVGTGAGVVTITAGLLQTANGNGVVCAAGTVNVASGTRIVSAGAGKTDLVQSGTGTINVYPGVVGSGTNGALTTTGTVTYVGLLNPTQLGSGTANNTTFLRGDSTWQVVSSATGANPTATVGTAAVNGVAATFMRSDAAPAVNLGMTPTWTGTHTFSSGIVVAGVTVKYSGVVTAVSQTGGASGEGEVQVAGGRFCYQIAGAGTASTFTKQAAAGVVGIYRGGDTVGGTIASIPLSPAALSADQNDYAPGVALNTRLATNGAGARNITGLVAGTDGEHRWVLNVGTDNVVLKHQSASSTAANRFLCDSGADVTLAANARAHLIYDGTTARWRVK